MKVTAAPTERAHLFTGATCGVQEVFIRTNLNDHIQLNKASTPVNAHNGTRRPRRHETSENDCPGRVTVENSENNKRKHCSETEDADAETLWGLDLPGTPDGLLRIISPESDGSCADHDKRGDSPVAPEPGMWALSHTRSAVSPYIEQDLKKAQAVSIDTWSQAVFNIPPGRLDEWAGQIKESGWYEDDIVQQSLAAYCKSTNESGRYKPTVDLTNHIIELARGNLTGLDKHYPLDDFTFADNHDSVVEPIEEHEGLGAHRKPDILGLRRQSAKKLEETRNAIRWTDILLVLELKFGTKLLAWYNADRNKRGLPDVTDLETSQEPEDKETALAGTERSSSNPGEPVTQEPVNKVKKVPANRLKKPLPSRSLGEDDLLATIGVRRPPLAADRAKPKVQEDEAKREVAIQTASYALEVLSCTYGTRAFTLCIILKDDHLSLWYYDACGVVYTKQRLSLITEFEKFAAIIVGFAQCTPEQFGAIPASVLRPHTPYERKFPIFNLNESSLWINHPTTKEDVGIELDESIFAQYGLLGRRTFLYTIETDRVVSAKKMIIKFSYQVATRQPEHTLVEIARRVKVRHIPEVHMWADLWKMSHGARRVFFQEDSEPPYEDRVFRAIVYTRYSSIRPLFSECIEIIPVMVYQMINCLDDLWTKARMLHRDISINNIMYEKRGDYYHFVLIDFDMAVVLPKHESTYVASSSHRTGTLPFMAKELIYNAWMIIKTKGARSPIKHLLRHDLESLLWVSLWGVSTLLTKYLTHDETEALAEWVRSWEVGNLNDIAGRKNTICCQGLDECEVVFPPHALCLKPWFDAWTQTLEETYTFTNRWMKKSKAQKDKASTLEWETAGGTLTPKNLKKILLESFPIPEQYLQESNAEKPKKSRKAKPAVIESEPKVRPARKKAKTTTTSAVAPENDIRARLRPRKPRVNNAGGRSFGGMRPFLYGTKLEGTGSVERSRSAYTLLANTAQYPATVTVGPEVPVFHRFPRPTLPSIQASLAPEPGMWALSHTRSAVSPYIREDLKKAQAVPIDTWAQAVFNIPPGRLDQWTGQIKENGWYNDDIIQQFLTSYCTATCESERYTPIADLANRIVELARGNLTGLDEHYPIDDFTFSDNQAGIVEPIEEHEGLGARRKPGVLSLRRESAKRLAESGSVRWTDVLLVLELKYRADLLTSHNAGRNERGLPAVTASGSRPEPKDAEPASTIVETDSSNVGTLSDRAVPYELLNLSFTDRTGRDPEAQQEDTKGEEDLLAAIDRYPSPLAIERAKPKAQEEDAKREVAIQTASYALEMLSCTYGTRSYTLCVIAKDDNLSLWYYDACGVVYTKQRLSLVTAFEKFAAIIVGFAQCTPEQLGALPAAVLRPSVPYEKKFPLSNLNESRLWMNHPTTKEDVGVALEEPIFTQYGLLGRRTFLYAVETDRVVSTKKMIVKFSYQVSTRKPEHTLVEIARKAKVRHIPEVHMWADLWNMSDGVRRIFFQGTDDPPYEDRIFRAIMYTRYSSIKPLFSERIEIIPVMVYQMTNCLDDLWTKARMLHRDVSINNIMYEKRGDDYHFVLIDFDMAIALPNDESAYAASSNHRTGTLPFMAKELILNAWVIIATNGERSPIRHLLRHDLESLFWVTLWGISTLLTSHLSPDGAKALLEWVRSWEVGELSDIAGRKGMLCSMGLVQTPVTFPPPASCLMPWFRAWTNTLRWAYFFTEEWMGMSPAEQEETSTAAWETAGGKLTPANLKEVLLEAFPIPEQYLKESDTEKPSKKSRRAKPAVVPMSEPKPRPARKKAKTTTNPAVVPENDIRSRLRPRKRQVRSLTIFLTLSDHAIPQKTQSLRMHAVHLYTDDFKKVYDLV
ncbi:hypothetical protein NM688_g3026 [Phlebia brevispora]|uniref:Uncharacterized protein n=1 Tax=Phlebia brevispora TaxID=194682 RepID=A0ACC1T6Y2_9APHY|nr:hypothetical protein NM688_g3026 [Phlebia brevispora]